MASNHSKTIGVISQYFYPDPSSTGRLLTDLAIGLGKKGTMFLHILDFHHFGI